MSAIEDFLTDEKSHFISANCQMQFFKFLFFIIGKWESASSISYGPYGRAQKVQSPVSQNWCIKISPCLPNRGVPSRDVSLIEKICLAGISCHGIDQKISKLETMMNDFFKPSMKKSDLDFIH